jgi:hypothetical protein
MPFIRIGNLIDGKDVGYWCSKYAAEVKRNAEMADALETTALAMDLRAGKKLTENAYNRVMEKYGGAMAASYLEIAEALGTVRVTRKDDK